MEVETMETKVGLYWGILILSVMPWLIGLYGQKVNNVQKSNAYRFKSNSLGIWLLGLRPGKGYVYIGPAIFQIWAIIAFVTGSIAIYFWGSNGLRMVIYIVYLGGIGIMALVGWTMKLANRK